MIHFGFSENEFRDYRACLKNLKVGDSVIYYKQKWSSVNSFGAYNHRTDYIDKGLIIFIYGKKEITSFDLFEDKYILPSIVIGSNKDRCISGLHNLFSVRDIYNVPVPQDIVEELGIKSARVLDRMIMVAKIIKAK